MWAFEMKNGALSEELAAYQVTTSYIEQRAGMLIWGNLTGPEIEKEKKKVRRIWRH
jgi:endonuclease G